MLFKGSDSLFITTLGVSGAKFDESSALGVWVNLVFDG